jgi:DNA polymerase/3'-5' exonuclease PolX
MQVPGIGPRTADRLVGELHVRGLKGLASAARRGRLRRLRGIGPARERAWGEAAALLMTPAERPRAAAATSEPAAPSLRKAGPERAA